MTSSLWVNPPITNQPSLSQWICQLKGQCRLILVITVGVFSEIQLFLRCIEITHTVNLIREDLAADQQINCSRAAYSWQTIPLLAEWHSLPPSVCEGRNRSHTLLFENITPVFHGIGFQLGDIFTSQTFWKGNPPFGPESWNPTPHRGALGVHIQASVSVQASISVQNDRSFS